MTGKKNQQLEEFLTMAEAMRMELTGGKQWGLKATDIEVELASGKWLREARERMLHPQKIDKIEVASTFRATLREYQNSGYQWFHVMTEMGLGACLADDMGLGKTVQVIALLEYIRKERGGKVLLILPASLIGNWQSEIDQFAPELPYQVLHGSAKPSRVIPKAGMSKNGDRLNLPTKGDGSQEEAFLYMTTYGMAARWEEFQHTQWDLLILDEAQAIKNGGTKQSKMVNPFILRRLKTDRTIISDLPDKVEIKEYASLTKKQIGLYEKLIVDIRTKLETADGMARKGLVLSCLMKKILM